MKKTITESFGDLSESFESLIQRYVPSFETEVGRRRREVYKQIEGMGKVSLQEFDQLVYLMPSRVFGYLDDLGYNAYLFRNHLKANRVPSQPFLDVIRKST